MARIGGVNIPNHQHAEIALTAIYGVGRSRARKGIQFHGETIGVGKPSRRATAKARPGGLANSVPHHFISPLLTLAPMSSDRPPSVRAG